VSKGESFFFPPRGDVGTVALRGRRGGYYSSAAERSTPGLVGDLFGLDFRLVDSNGQPRVFLAKTRALATGSVSLWIRSRCLAPRLSAARRPPPNPNLLLFFKRNLPPAAVGPCLRSTGRLSVLTTVQNMNSY
jgi:hypothetical protein